MYDNSEGYNAYCTYHAIMLHFAPAPNSNSKKYDYVKYKGKTRITSASYLKIKDRFLFEKIQRNYKDDLEQFFIAQYFDLQNAGKKLYVREMTKELYINHTRIIDSFTYHMTEQVNLWFMWLDDNRYDLQTVLKEQKYAVFELLVEGKLSVYFFQQLNAVTLFASIWKDTFTDPLWQAVYCNWLIDLTTITKPIISTIIPKLFKEILDQRTSFKQQLSKEY